MSPAQTDPDPGHSAARGNVRRSMLRVMGTLGALLLGWIAIWGPVLLVGKGLVPLVDTAFHPGPDMLSVIRRTCIIVFAITGYWAFVHWHEKRQANELTLRPIPLLAGGASGAVLIALPVALLFALGAYQVEHVHGIQPSLLGAAGLIAIAATLEELTFRCLLFRVLERRWGTAWHWSCSRCCSHCSTWKMSRRATPSISRPCSST